MKYFHNHRRPSQRRYYDVKDYLYLENSIKNIKIERKMKKWDIIRTINILQVLNANIQDPVLNEIFIKTPSMIENYEQIEDF
jgi:hypothetical protein